MNIYLLEDSGGRRYFIRANEQRIEVYYGGEWEMIFNTLPHEFKWENLDVVVANPKGKLDLTKKLSEIYKKI